MYLIYFDESGNTGNNLNVRMSPLSLLLHASLTTGLSRCLAAR